MITGLGFAQLHRIGNETLQLCRSVEGDTDSLSLVGSSRHSSVMLVGTGKKAQLVVVLRSRKNMPEG
jgi:hypothetical protein